MLTPSISARIFVYFKSVDMRKAINGLSSLVISDLSESPRSGDLFIFRNRAGNKIKIIYWDRNGFVMFYKRLDKGGFKFPKRVTCGSITITSEQLDWLLMGFDFMLPNETGNNVIHYY